MNRCAKPLLMLWMTLMLSACGGGSPGGTTAGEGEQLQGSTEQPNNNTPALESGAFRVLVFTRTVGFRHVSIEAGVSTLQSLGAQNDFTVTQSEDPADFNSSNLAQYRVVLFLNTTLNVLDTAEQRQALQAFVEAGGGYVGVHSAADTEHDWPWYGELVGAYFLSHPVQQTGRFDIEASSHPSVSHLPNPWTIFDEFYSFKTSPRGAVNVLISADESSYLQNPNTSCLPDGPTFPNGFDGRMGDHPMSWCHDKFAGRAWYTALGHEVAMYQLPEFQQHLVQGVLIAARRVAANCAVSDPDVTPVDPSSFDTAPTPCPEAQGSL